MKQNATQIINARWIIPVDENIEAEVLENHSVVINNQKIEAIVPSQQAKEKYSAEQFIDLPNHTIIPGLINAHTHASMSLFRGLADDMPLMQWLNDFIWPAEAKWVSEDFIRDGTQLAIAEMIRSGTTCFNDMYFFPDVTAQVAAEMHMRATVGMIVIDFPSTWAANHNEYFEKGLKVHDDYRDHPLVQTAFAPHAPYSVADDALKRVQMLADELQVPIHMHVHETREEIQMGLDNFDKRPIARLNDHGLLSPSLMAVHMTQLNEEEISLFSQTGSHIVHCPQSNLKLASGFCPVAKLLKNNINVCLGTDSAASNNNLDMMSEMQTAALLAKGIAEDASALPAIEALKMATINGAKALGIDEITGSITPGKSADLVAINMNRLGTQPVYHPVSQVVYSCQSGDISDVWITGKRVLHDQRLTQIDEASLLEKARSWQAKIAQ